jgi:SAM-dependent methyltransferase
MTKTTSATPSAGLASVSDAELLVLMRDLFADQLAVCPDDYLASHSLSDAAILRRISVLRRFEKHVSGRFLDWGCRHAPDSCMLRRLYGDKLELIGCDFSNPGDWRVFHEYAGLQYTQLNHPYNIPYKDGEFDVVLSSGVLEHVPNDYESLKEVYRILKVGGTFVITFLPNRFSYTEFLARMLGRSHHLRRYDLTKTEKLLLHCGFEIVASGYHQMVPSLAGLAGHSSVKEGDPSGTSGDQSGKHAVTTSTLNLIWKLNSLLEWLWPLRMLSSNLYLVSRKRESM